MTEPEILAVIRQGFADAMGRRRGLVAFTRLEAKEMDREARALERDTIEEARKAIPETPFNDRLLAVRARIDRMREQLDALMPTEVRESSKLLERDDITWRAFEDIAHLLEVE